MESLSFILCAVLSATFVAMTSSSDVILIVDIVATGGLIGQIYDPERGVTDQTDNFGSTYTGVSATASCNKKLFTSHERNLVVWDYATDTFMAFPNATLQARTAHSMECVNNGAELILCGGVPLPAKTSCELCRVSRGAPSCVPIADMPVGRYDHASVVINDSTMLVIGGDGGDHDLNTVFCYNIKKNTWYSNCVPPMNQQRGGFPGAVLLDGHILLVCGGYVNGRASFGSFLSSCESIDMNVPYEGWTTVNSMQQPRSLFGMVSMSDGLVYALGGRYARDGLEFVETVEVYNPKTEIWSLTPYNLNDGVYTWTAARLQ
jgi:hypothetical protein